MAQWMFVCRTRPNRLRVRRGILNTDGIVSECATDTPATFATFEAAEKLRADGWDVTIRSRFSGEVSWRFL